jgi:hypothetical protein
MRIVQRIAAVLATAALASFISAAASAGVLIEIDKEAQRMSVSVDGAQRYFWPVSTGRAGRLTPEGEFKPFRLEEDHYSKEWDDAPMPHSIFFTRQGHAIHGSYDVKKLGSPASAGCVRLAPANAAALFQLVKEQGLGNVKVVIAGEEPTVSVKRQTPTRRASGEPLQVTPERVAPNRARVWPDETTEREALDAYAARMRRRYYEGQPPPLPPLRRSTEQYYEPQPRGYAVPRYYIAPRNSYYYE